MNREDVIRMARGAGLSGLMEGGLIDYFERFAALVAAAENEACAQACDEIHAKHTAEFGDYLSDSYATECAAAIRARGKND